MNPKLLFTAVLLSITAIACGGNPPSSPQFDSSRLSDPSPLASVPEPDTKNSRQLGTEPRSDKDADKDADKNLAPDKNLTPNPNLTPRKPSGPIDSPPPATNRVGNGESFLAPAPAPVVPAPAPVDSFSTAPTQSTQRPAPVGTKSEAAAAPVLTRMSSETAPNAAIEQAIRQEVPGAENEVRYYYNQVDLSGDGTPEALVYLTGSYTCGSGGCSLLILSPQNQGGYSVVSQMSLVNAPVIVSGDRTSGWNDLVIPIKGGGATPHYARLQFDGSGYPGNPSMAPEVPASDPISGTAVMTDADVQGGIPLVR
jgi:hypothetical protein